MLLNLQHYHRPASLAEAIALVRKNPDAVVPLAGGTYLVSSDSRHVTEVVDITQLGLSFINQADDVWRIGATTILQEIIDAALIQELAQGILAEASRATTVSRMRRNVSTIGGEVIMAAPSSGVPVALLALDARLRIVDPSERELPVTDFYLEDAHQALRGAILTEVIIPKPRPGARSAFLSLAQTPSSIPIVQIAALVDIDQRVCQDARLAVGAATARPVRVPSAEALLVGHKLDEAAIHVAAEEVAASIRLIDDARGSAEYRRHLSRVLTRRALSLAVSSQQSAISNQ